MALFALIVGLLLGAPIARGQDGGGQDEPTSDRPSIPAGAATESTAATGPELMAAGDAQAFWIVRVLEEGKFRVLYRPVAAPEDTVYRLTETSGRPIAIAAGDGRLFVVYADRSMQRLSVGRNPTDGRLIARTVQLPPLPDGARLVDLAADAQGPLVLMSGPTPGASTEDAEADEPAGDVEGETDANADAETGDVASGEIAAGDMASGVAGLQLARPVGGAWQPIDLPADLAPPHEPRLIAVGAVPTLLYRDEEGAALTVLRLRSGQWSSTRHELPLTAGFAAAAAMRHPVVADQATGGEPLRAHVLRGEEALFAGTLPIPVGMRLEWAAAGQAHNLIAVIDPAEGPLRWVRRDLRQEAGATPHEAELTVTEPEAAGADLQFITWIIIGLSGALVLLVIQRNRDRSLTELPKDTSVCEFSRRLGAGVLDLAPPYLLVAFLHPAIDAPGELAMHWNLSPETGWAEFSAVGMAVGLFVLHTGLSELLTGQTLGKKAVGCRVVAEDGSDPDLWQVLARNGVKALEVLAWPLLLFVLLNPARQRLGDLVARTLVVRPAPPSTGNPPPEEE